MIYNDKINLLPKSIYNTSSNTNLEKTWRLFALQLNEVEENLLAWYDKETLSGAQLDHIGKLKGIPRNGLSDEDYRYELSLPRSLEIVTLNAIYEVANTFGTSVKIYELYEPYLFDVRRLDASLLLDGTWLLDNQTEPFNVYRLDSTWLLDGTNILEPYNIRNLSILIELETNSSYPYNKLPNEVSKLLAGISVNYKYTVHENIGLDWNLLTTKLDGTWLLDGTKTLNPSIEIALYFGNTEIERLTPTIEASQIRFTIPRKNYVITKIKVIRSNEELYSLNVNIQTSMRKQYEFILI